MAGARLRTSRRWLDETSAPRERVSTPFETLIVAAQAGAPQVAERPNDPYRSFREAALESAIAEQLPGQVQLTQQRRRFEIPGFDPYPYGVDIDWRDDGVHAGIEAKIWDVGDSLFDVVKLTTAIFHRRLDEGFCAVAALASHWAAGNAFCAMTAA